MPVATTHAAVNALLRDRRFGREPVTPRDIPDHLAPFYAVEAHSMLELEPPRHTRLRSLVLRAFTSRRITALAPEIAALTHDLIDAFPEGSFDLLDAFCRPIPVIVIARLLGVPEAMAPELLRWSNAMVMMYQAGRGRADEDAAVAATIEFVAFMRSYIDRRRSDPRDDLISALIAAEDDLGHLLGRAGGHDLAAAIAALGADVDHPVGGLDDVEIVLDHHDRVALVDQLVQHFQQLAHVLEMQARGGLVEDVERAARWSVSTAPWTASRAAPRRPTASSPAGPP
jgi:hypothetical protein